MASKTTLNEQNLRSLGLDRLAELVMELVTGDAALKRRARAALLETAGGDALAREIGKRIATLKRSSSFVDWHKHRALADDLERLRATITEKIAGSDPDAALDLMWRFLDLAGPTYERADDSNGILGDIFREACADLGVLAQASNLDPATLADQVFATAVEDNGYAQYDYLITYVTPSLGEEGLAHLKEKIRAKQKSLAQNSGGKADYDQRRMRSALQEIADAEGDVDAYIAGYDEHVRTVPAIAAGIAERLLKDGRAGEAMAALDKTEFGRGWIPEEWDQVRLTILEALDRHDEAQGFRWSRFEETLSIEMLRGYLKRLPDFEDVEAEDRAMSLAAAFSDIHAALSFFIAWPDLEKAASLVLDHREAWDGNRYYSLGPAAEAIEGQFPLAAIILRRAMILYTLSSAKSKRYKHAARHLLECDSLAAGVEDFGGISNHDAFIATLRNDHPRKTSFWALVGPA